MNQVLPSHALSRLEPNHPIYKSQYTIQTVNYTQAAIVQKKLKNPTVPALEGIVVDGHLAVVYTPFDVGCGWELKPHPYTIGYESQDAIKLGVNVVIHAVTH
jgi:hypothetical protein